MPITECETHRIACISNLHLSVSVLGGLCVSAKAVSTEHARYASWAGPYGLIVAAPTKLADLDDYLIRGATAHHASQLWNVMHWAFTNKYRYVMFDRDADVVPALPAYREDWD